MPINLTTGTIGKPISKINNWQSIALDSNTQTLYLAGGPIPRDNFTNIVPVGITTGKTGTPIPVPGEPAEIDISPDGRTAYVLTQGGGTLTPVNLATRTVGTPIAVPDGVSELAIAPSGTMAYATGNANLGTTSFVTPIDLVTGTVESPISLRHAPDGIVLSTDGRTAYVAGGTYPPGSVGPPVPPDVTSINLTTGRVSGTFSIPGGASGIFNVTGGGGD